MIRINRWTEEELDILKNNYLVKSDKQLLEILNRHTLSSIQDKRKNLKLYRTSILPKGENHYNWKGGKEKINCEICKKEIYRAKWEIKRSNIYFCSNECKSSWMSQRTGEKHPQFKGKYITSDGYITIYSPNHPNAKDGYIKLHRLVVEDFIGRYLNKDEVVHHIDFDRQNNSINNLMLFKNQSEHIKFHIKFSKFGMNRQIRNQIMFRWKEYKLPRSSNEQKT